MSFTQVYNYRYSRFRIVIGERFSSLQLSVSIPIQCLVGDYISVWSTQAQERQTSLPPSSTLWVSRVLIEGRLNSRSTARALSPRWTATRVLNITWKDPHYLNVWAAAVIKLGSAAYMVCPPGTQVEFLASFMPNNANFWSLRTHLGPIYEDDANDLVSWFGSR